MNSPGKKAFFIQLASSAPVSSQSFYPRKKKANAGALICKIKFMARKRMISPIIWEDPTFNSLSIPGRLAFVGMISNADDDGYLRGDYGSLKRLIYGFDEKAGKDWYQELQTYRNLHFFEVNGESFVHLLNWDKYQTQREDRRQPSVYPLCVVCQADVRQVPAEVSKLSKDKLSKEVGKGRLKFLDSGKHLIGKPF